MNNGAAFDALMTCFKYAYFACMVPEEREDFLAALSNKLHEYEQNAEVARVSRHQPELSSADLERVREWVDDFKKRVERT